MIRPDDPAPQSLSRRMALYLVILLLASGAAIFILGALLLSQNTSEELERKMEEYRIFLPRVLAPALWDMNDTTVSIVSQAFTQNDFITLLSVRDGFGREVHSYRREGEVSSLLKETEIYYGEKRVGFLTLGLGRRYFEDLSVKLFFAFVGIFLLLVICIAMGTKLMIRTVISRPFEILGRQIRDFEPGKPGAFQGGILYRETQPLVERLRTMGEIITLQVQELQESESKFRTLMETSPVPMAITDPRGRIEKLNHVFTQLMGYTLEDIPDITAWSVLAYPEPALRQILFQEWETRIRESVTNGTPFRPMEVTILAKDRTIRHLEIRHVMMSRFSLTTFQDLTGRKQNEEALQKALTELEAKNSEMERYMYTVSHDLKSPLVTIKGYAGYLEKTLIQEGMESALKDLGRIQKAADRASELLQDLLHLSRVGRDSSLRATVDMEALLHEVLDAFAPQIASVSAEFTIRGHWPTVTGQKARLEEVWQNLVENSLKYRSPDRIPKLVFEAREFKDYWQFSLQDNGLGVDQTYLGKIFDIFEKIDPKTEGSGIGLAIVRRIVEFHGGQIWAVSQAQGMTVCFTLPQVK